MAYVASFTVAVLKQRANGQRWYGESEECVAVVKHFCNAPQTTGWKKGLPVRGHATIQPGTAIATFTAPNNGYRGHAAIYMGQNDIGLQVLDQWKGRKFQPRTISFDTSKRVSNDGNQFYVIN